METGEDGEKVDCQDAGHGPGYDAKTHPCLGAHLFLMGCHSHLLPIQGPGVCALTI